MVCGRAAQASSGSSAVSRQWGQGVAGLNLRRGFTSSQPMRAAEEAAEADEEAVPLPPADGVDIVDPKVVKLVDEVCQLSLLETSQFCDLLKEKLNITEPVGMPMGGVPMMAAPGAGGDAGGAEEPAEEKLNFDVKLTGFDAKAKIKIIKEVRSLTDLGLKEAKETVEAAADGGKVLVEGLNKEDAEAMKAKLEELGGTVELV